MKKAIQILVILILLSIIALGAVFVFNPFNLRTKLIASMINSYLEGAIEDYAPLDKDSDIAADPIAPGGLPADKHPLLNEDQENTLENYGVDISKLPTSISPEMEKCFIEKLGQERADEIIGGDSPGAMEILKARSCLGE